MCSVHDLPQLLLARPNHAVQGWSLVLPGPGLPELLQAVIRLQAVVRLQVDSLVRGGRPRPVAVQDAPSMSPSPSVSDSPAGRMIELQHTHG